MPPEVRALLLDMREAANSIAEFAAGNDIVTFLSDKKLRSAAYYQFAIVGEALSRLRDLDSATIDKISEHWRIIGFRNQIIHGYAKIDDEITWRIIENKLPVLRRELDELLSAG